MPEARFDPRAERPSEIIGWTEPSVSDPEWTVKVRVNRTSPVRIHITDEDGHVVRVLSARRMTPGDYGLRWDGLEAGGMSLRPGRYDLRLDSPVHSETVELTTIEE